MKQRIVTGICAGLILLGILFFTSTHFFLGFTTLIMLFAAWEWGALCSFKAIKARILYVVIILIMLWLSTLISNYHLMYVATIWWLVAFIITILFLLGYEIHRPVVVAIIGVLVLVPTWSAINILRVSAEGTWLIFFFILIVGALDSGAYFVGTWMGETKLAPSISPKKTIEGLIGGIVLALIIAYVFLAMVKPLQPENWLIILGTVLLLAFFALLGDLFESLFKRLANVKDSGKLLPGHGGILDRVDSYTAALPPFVLLLMFLGYIH